MKLPELAEILQADLEAGVLNFIVYQEGRKWKYENYGRDNDNVNQEAEKKYITIKSKMDDRAIIINGKKDFSFYDVEYIQKKIKALYR
ncbi:hypothetical protein Amet_3734 [Alkaliphilus metalliredigens QYMF]|uniref:Large polyvalent-protein-associated domain-containing protein n=1 Tax=Alkaliphilus metalliredigens (strain QYMF) TaxID=293826 RepID=A6TUI5_ALKMQ|nr:hypothetical protein [Alkaliphilus metalliredigens]ABR49853.1 hypothetical protein Amet_3734 [Alkaliphilus metalliredigens QYMF]